MGLGDHFPAETIRSQLVPGRIVHLECAFAGKPKFVVIATIQPGPNVLVINSEINRFIQNRPAMANCQVTLDQASHTFLDHDSWIACHEVKQFDLGEMHAQVESDTSRIKCCISDNVKENVIEAIRAAPTISSLVKAHIYKGLQ